MKGRYVVSDKINYGAMNSTSRRDFVRKLLVGGAAFSAGCLLTGKGRTFLSGLAAPFTDLLSLAPPSPGDYAPVASPESGNKGGSPEGQKDAPPGSKEGVSLEREAMHYTALSGNRARCSTCGHSIPGIWNS